MNRFVACLVALQSTIALAIPLSPVPTFCTSFPDQCNIGSQSLMVVRGSGTNAYYVLEADPATGELPVSIATGISVDFSGPTGAPVPSDAAYVAGIDGSGNLQGLHVDTSGDLQVDILTLPYAQNYGAVGATTLRSACMLGLGSTVVSNANPVPISDAGGSITVDGTVSASNFPATVNTDYGTPGASTPRSACMLGVGSTAVANGNPVPISDAGGSITVDGTVSASNFPATVNTDYGAPGASTVRSACMLGVGSTAVANGNPVPISDAGGSITVDGTVAVSNLPTTADTNYGSPGASTVRTAAMLGIGSTAASVSNPVPIFQVGHAYADSVRNDYSSTNVTTGAWVQMIASTAALFNIMYITDTCGQILELGTGAPASETRKLLIPRGGMAEPVWETIPAGTRISLRAVSGNCTTGDFVLTGLN